MHVVLISTYDMGRQPFGVASPAAWLHEAGAPVTCMDLAIERLDERAVARADLIAFYVPMHLAGRLAASVAGRVRVLNPHAHLCFYGLYAPVNETFFRELGAGTVLGGEFEEGLVQAYHRLAQNNGAGAADPQPEPTVSLARQDFLVPKRDGLPALERYARLTIGPGVERVVG